MLEREENEGGTPTAFPIGSNTDNLKSCGFLKIVHIIEDCLNYASMFLPCFSLAVPRHKDRPSRVNAVVLAQRGWQR